MGNNRGYNLRKIVIKTKQKRDSPFKNGTDITVY